MVKRLIRHIVKAYTKPGKVPYNRKARHKRVKTFIEQALQNRTCRGSCTAYHVCLPGGAPRVWKSGDPDLLPQNFGLSLEVARFRLWASQFFLRVQK